MIRIKEYLVGKETLKFYILACQGTHVCQCRESTAKNHLQATGYRLQIIKFS